MVISANSFWILFAEVVRAFDDRAGVLLSFLDEERSFEEDDEDVAEDMIRLKGQEGFAVSSTQ
jgi:hypothetical protein